MLVECFVCENTRRAYFHKISAELVFQNSVFVLPKIYAVVPAENVQIAAAGVVLVKSYAAVALNASVHFMSEEWAKVLVPISTLLETISAICMPHQDRHILQMTLAAFIAYRAVVRMIQHQPFDDTLSKRQHLRVVDGNAHAVCYQGHAGHYYLTLGIVLILELLYGAHSARAD